MDSSRDTSSAASSPADQIAIAQHEKLRLEIAKLQAEVHANSWQATAQALTPLVSVLIGLIGFVFGVVQFQLVQSERRKADAAAELAQAHELQARIETDVESLLLFFTDKKQTVSTARLHFETLKAHLTKTKSFVSIRPRVVFMDEHAITDILIQAILYDCDLDQYREAIFLSVLMESWPDYLESLKDRPEELRYIATKYGFAMEKLRLKTPAEFTQVKFDPKLWFTWPREPGPPTFSDRRHLDQLVVGMVRHLKLYDNENHKREEVARFAYGIGNGDLARYLIAQSEARR